MDEKTTAEPLKEMPLKTHHHSASHNLDGLAALSIFGAVAAGLYSIANNIRSKFYKAFVLGYGESSTPFDEMVQKYTGKETGLFSNTAHNLKNGIITHEEYKLKNRKLAKEFRGEFEEMLLKDFKIPSRGWSGWTTGTLQRWRELGVTNRIESTAGGFSIVAFSIAAISVLKHSKRTLDRIEDRLADQQEILQQRQL